MSGHLQTISKRPIGGHAQPRDMREILHTIHAAKDDYARLPFFRVPPRRVDVATRSAGVRAVHGAVHHGLRRPQPVRVAGSLLRGPVPAVGERAHLRGRPPLAVVPRGRRRTRPRPVPPDDRGAARAVQRSDGGQPAAGVEARPPRGRRHADRAPRRDRGDRGDRQRPVHPHRRAGPTGRARRGHRAALPRRLPPHARVGPRSHERRRPQPGGHRAGRPGAGPLSMARRRGVRAVRRVGRRAARLRHRARVPAA